MPYPFHGKEFEFAQPDGRKIKLLGWGDQSRAIFETVEGFTVIKNPMTGFHEYAKLSEDKDSSNPPGLRSGSMILRPQACKSTCAARMKHLWRDPVWPMPG